MDFEPDVDPEQFDLLHDYVWDDEDQDDFDESDLDWDLEDDE